MLGIGLGLGLGHNPASMGHVVVGIVVCQKRSAFSESVAVTVVQIDD